MEGRSLRTAALFLLYTLLSLISLPTRAQSVTDLETTFSLDADEESATYGTLAEECADLLSHKIDLNTAGVDELSQLPFLAESDIRAILKFRYTYGRFASLYDLMLVPGLQREYARMAMPYLTITADEAPATRRRDRSQQQVLMEADRCLSERAGYADQSAELIAKNKAYRGNPWHNKVRYQYNYGTTIRAGITIDKDAGETYRNGAPWVGDSFNYYAAYRRSRGIVRQVIVGDYRASMGCGLLINQNFSIGKTMLSAQLLRRSAGIAPQTSAEEYKFLEGAATELCLGEHVAMTAFVSTRLIDGITTDSTLTSISTDGYHRTKTEESRRHSARMSVGGMHADWSNHWLRVGLNALHTRFDRPYERTVRYYNMRWFRGLALTQASAEYALHLSHFDAKGEWAVSDNGGMGTVHLIHYTPAERLNLLLIGRLYGRDYQQLHASTFGESSDTQAERGLYLQGVYNAAAHLDLTASMDYFRLTAPKYGIATASSGYEAQVRADVKHTRWSASLRYRLKQKSATNNVSTVSAALQGIFRHSTDLIVTWQPCDWVRLREQAQLRIYSRQFVGSTSGFGFNQMVTLRRDTWPIALNAQAAWFHTDDYNSRLYLSDLNLRYSYSSTMVYGLGVRYGASLSWRVSPHWIVEGKYTLVNYGDRTTITSGLQQIQGNTQQDVRVQVLWKI